MEISNLKTSHSYDRINKKPPAFNGLLELSAGVQNNAVLNRGLVDAGGTFPWIINSNNKQEAWERFIKCTSFLVLAFVAPIINVPIANRLFMWCCGLTNGWSDNNHKAIQLSNKYLTSDKNLMEGLNKYNILLENGKPKISERFFSSPLEKVYKKVTGQQLNDKINIKELLKKCGGDVSLLRKRISRAKNLTLCSDLIITCVTLGFWSLFNNYLTQKRTGKTGYSAEFNMADKNIIEERAKEYKKNRKRCIEVVLAEIAIIAGLIPLIVHKSLLSNSKNTFTNFIKKYATWTDYTKGIFMSKFTTVLGLFCNISGLILGSRNNTERKDNAIRNGISIPIFLGADLLFTSLISNLSDKLFKTKLCEKTQKQGILSKIFPQYKSLEKIAKEVTLKQISPHHKGIATTIYWGCLGICTWMIAYLAPAICNKMIKHDVEEYVNNKNNSKNLTSSDKTTKINNIDTKGIFKEFIIKK